MHRPVTLPAWAERAAGRQVVPFLLYVAGLPGRKGSSGCVLSKACNCDFSSWGFMFPSPRIRWTVVLPKPVAFANDCRVHRLEPSDGFVHASMVTFVFTSGGTTEGLPFPERSFNPSMRFSRKRIRQRVQFCPESPFLITTSDNGYILLLKKV